MTLEDLKNYFGNGNRFEKETGISHTSWGNWFKDYGFVPIRSQRKIEIITQGALKADLKDLPDVDY